MTGDPSVHARVIEKRGLVWYNEIDKLRREHLSLTILLAREMYEKFKL